ncbi:transposase [Stenotrophomonas sp. PS02301]|uniref:transposase n=1 Tax=Stenotrophomonas sp. PS02301 TaxID=2991427 RepID=UPI00249AAF58|nr:transposase [Stenotrophomonas sp. PS02301]
MPRSARLVLPGIPLHVIQRGVNRAALFIDDEDRCHYLRLLRNACRKQAVAIHAFVLMGNHVHLLITPSTAEGLAPAMRQCGQNYVQYFNKRHVRSGTLLEGRFKSCLVDSDGYLLMVHRYIELNPVRAAMVAFPEEYRWSSVRVYLGLEHNPMLTPHPCYTLLGPTPEARANAYSEWLRASIQPDERERIVIYVAQERALGSPRFQDMVGRALQRSVVCRPAGRPVKETGD